MRNRRNKNIFFNLAVLSILAMLSGCASLNSKFDCPRGPGISCKSITEINALVDKGQVGNPNNDKKTKKIIDNLNNSIWDKDPPSIDYTSNAQAQKEQEEQKEQGLRIWMAPYEDFYGNYHEQSYVYAKVKNDDGAERNSENLDEKALSIISKNPKNKCEHQKIC